MNHSAAARFARALEDVQSAADVRVNKGAGGRVAVGDRDQRGKVEDDLDVAAGLPHQPFVANVSQHHLQPLALLRPQLIQPAP